MTAQLIHAYYRAFNARDYTGMLALLADGVVHEINQGPRELGRDHFRSFLERMDAAYREHIDALVVLGEESERRFAAEFTVLGKYLTTQPGMPAASGQSYRLTAGAFFEVDEGKITRVTTYYNVREWLKQVGE